MSRATAQAFKKDVLPKVLAWLEQAQKREKVSVQFGAAPNWSDCHGGGTSFAPFCRPKGIYNANTKKYTIKLFASEGDNSAQQKEVFSGIDVPSASGEQPSIEQTYAVMIKKVKEMIG